MWDDIKIFLHVVRRGSASAAAVDLNIDQSTVSRRIAHLEGELGVRLFDRTGIRLEPTASATALAEAAERAEEEIDKGLARAVGNDTSSGGVVRITAVPYLIQRILVPGLPRLLGAFPDLVPEFLGTQRNLNLARREADIAVRFGRPQSGDLLVRRIGGIEYGAFRHREADPGSGWICYEEKMHNLPESVFLERAARRGGVVARVGDQQSLIMALKARLGHSILPIGLGDCFEEFEKVDTSQPKVTRDVWLLVHPDLRSVPRIDAAISWIVELFENPDRMFAA